MKDFVFKSSETKIFFVSDTHFNHSSIIEMCKRPFKDVEEMNEKLIENWNKVVDDDAIVFHLGDFIWKGNWNSIIERLNGRIYLIIGNHDRKRLGNSYDKFEGVFPQMQISIDGRSIYLNHYPFLCYGGTYKTPETAVYQLFGHVHTGSTGLDTSRMNMLFPYQYDVGVDNNNYTPVSWEQVNNIIKFQIENDKNISKD